MILWKKWGLRIADCFFDETIGANGVGGVDLIRYHQWSCPMGGCVCTAFWTRLIDLRQPLDRILAGMEADTRRQIRQSEKKDTFLYCHSEEHDPALLHEVLSLHDKFTSLKGLPKTNRARMWALWQARLLDISLTREPEGNPLVWQICYRDSRRVRGLYTGSFFRTMSDTSETHLVGRAHRYGRWKDILRLKDAGIETYDFGGWYMGVGDPDKVRINAFKKRFGGTIEKSFNCVGGATLAGKMIVAILDAKQRLTVPEDPAPPEINAAPGAPSESV